MPRSVAKTGTEIQGAGTACSDLVSVRVPCSYQPNGLPPRFSLTLPKKKNISDLLGCQGNLPVAMTTRLSLLSSKTEWITFHWTLEIKQSRIFHCCHHMQHVNSVKLHIQCNFRFKKPSWLPYSVLLAGYNHRRPSHRRCSKRCQQHQGEEHGTRPLTGNHKPNWGSHT